jgi:ATP-dependent Zn protease
MATLTMILGAMAAEHVFYGENGAGVGGDVQSATAIASWMVGASGMGPEPLKLNGSFADESPEETEKRIRERLQKLGSQIMNRTGGGPGTADPIAAVLGDRDKKLNAAEILGQAYIRAYNTMKANRSGAEHIASVLMEKRELYGDEVVRLLEDSNLKVPEYDLLDEASWPTI